jgi:putative aldouronate transport system permease protein
MSSMIPTTKLSILLKDIKRDKYLYAMIIPTLVWFIIFHYVPLIGNVIAFQNYNIGMGIFGNGDWVGFDNFQKLFEDSYFWRALRNTFIISFYRIAVCLPGAVILALMLNEIKNRRFKSIIQTFIYIPRFLSWVIVAEFAITLLNPDQGINYLLDKFNLFHITLSDERQFRSIVILSDLWKDVGFNSVIFLAAILSINPSLYEAAEIDGASRMQKIIYITLPSIKNTILVVLILWIGLIVNVGFDQVFNLYNPVVYSVGDILDTYIYRIAFESYSNFAIATAAGLFKSVVCIVLLLSAELFARGMGESAIFEKK